MTFPAVRTGFNQVYLMLSAEIGTPCLLALSELMKNWSNSASADGGPRSRVRARGTLRSAPHRH